jgi:uncharacterized membrane protein
VIRIEHTVNVATSARKAFAQWTQYDSYPLFMENVHAVSEISKNRLHWRALRNNAEVAWDSEITATVPDHMIAWRDISEEGNEGTVNIHEVDASHCGVQIIMHIHMRVPPEKMAQAEIMLIERLEGDLARFKALLEHPEAKPFDASSPGATGVEYGHHTSVPNNELLTNTPGSPRVPTPREAAKSPDADGKDNRIDLDAPARNAADGVKH